MSKVYLLDSNVLIALANPDHTLFQRARSWFGKDTPFATCPITQGSLIRYYLRNVPNSSVFAAKQLLIRLTGLTNHVFWPDDATYLDLPEKGVMGYRQVTDAYLVALTHKHRGILATMDEALAAIHPGVFLLPLHS